MNYYSEYTYHPLPWIEKMPAHWKLVRGKNLYKKMQRPVQDQDEVVTCFRDGTVTLRKNRRTTGFTESLLEIGYQGIRKGDLVIHVMDAFAGSIGVSDSDGKGTPVYSVCQAKGNSNNEYYALLLREMARTGFIQSLYRGIRERSSDFRFEVFASQFYPVPPRDEQDQIVRFLDWKVSSINKLISNYRHQIALLDEMKQRRIDEAVVKGMRKSNLVHNDDIRWDIDYPEHWQIQRIRESFSFRKGLSITKANLEETGIAVISYGQVHSKKNSGVGLNEELIRYVNESYLTTNQSCLVEKGDFIFADTSEDVTGCGNCAYIDWDETLFAGYHSIIAHPDGSTNNKYLAYLFKSPTWRYQIRKKVNGVKVYSITQKMLKDVFILVPPINEQEEIISHLDEVCAKIDATIKKMEEKISNLKDLRIRLVADTVTGKIDVRDIEIPEYEFVNEESDSGEVVEEETDE